MMLKVEVHILQPALVFRQQKGLYDDMREKDEMNTFITNIVFLLPPLIGYRNWN